MNCHHNNGFCQLYIHGYGTLITINDSEFSANWQEGTKQNSSKKILTDYRNASYEGYVINGAPNGWGEIDF